MVVISFKGHDYLVAAVEEKTTNFLKIFDIKLGALRSAYIHFNVKDMLVIPHMNKLLLAANDQIHILNIDQLIEDRGLLNIVSVYTYNL